MSLDRSVIDALPAPALLIGRDERIVVANAGARSLFGAGIEGRHYVTAIRQPGLLDAVEAALAGKKAEARYLASEVQRDSTWLATATPLATEPGAPVLVFLEDRTAMEEAGLMRRDFVANVSHELRTPLTALMGFVETLRGAAKDDPVARERFLEIMGREAGRMNRLVQDLLSLSRVEAEERLRPTGEADLAALVRSVTGTLRPLADAAGVDLKTRGLDEAMPLKGDADQLSQVATNLIENAIKYSGRGSTVNVSLVREDHSPMLRGPAVVLSVKDTGEGVDPIHIPRLTERFYRVDTHRSREMGGTGLGLAIVKHIVGRHRGRLRIESAPGQGSLFTVILPASG